MRIRQCLLVGDVGGLQRQLLSVNGVSSIISVAVLETSTLLHAEAGPTDEEMLVHRRSVYFWETCGKAQVLSCYGYRLSLPQLSILLNISLVHFPPTFLAAVSRIDRMIRFVFSPMFLCASPLEKLGLISSLQSLAAMPTATQSL